jgi:hypothetical protein
MILNGIDEISKRYWLIGSGDKTAIESMTGDAFTKTEAVVGEKLG